MTGDGVRTAFGVGKLTKRTWLTSGGGAGNIRSVVNTPPTTNA